MNESEFNEKIDATLIAIEEAVEDSGADIDFENANGILTLTCPDNSVVIINRQSAANQLWVAAKSGGFHFDFNTEENQWLRDDSEQEPLAQLLTRVVAEQSDETVDFVEALADLD